MEVIGNKGTCSDGDIPSKVINGCFSTGDHHPMIFLHVQSVCSLVLHCCDCVALLVMDQCRLGVSKYLFSQRFSQ